MSAAAPILAEDLMPMVRAAWYTAETLPAMHKADVLFGIAVVLRDLEPTTAQKAETYAAALREVEAMQLHFHDLFTREEEDQETTETTTSKTESQA